MKICYIVAISSTIESFFIPQLQYLASNGFDVTVVCSDDITLQQKLGESIRFYPIKIPRGVSAWGSISAVQTLTRFLKSEKFDLVQYSTPNAAFYSSIAAKKAGCKVRNYHLMGFRFLGASGAGRLILKWIEKRTCKNSTSIECVSKSNLEFGVQKNVFSKQKAVVVWNGSTGGVDLARFSVSKREQWRRDIRNELGYQEDDFVYGYVGRITKDKGINELLAAFCDLKDNRKLLLVGNIEENNHLDMELIERAHKQPNIMFHSVVSDIERYYAAIDVLVLPSYREGFGNVVIEAGAVGTPAIVSDIPGPTDAIDRGNTALVVPAKDITALKEAMQRIYKMDYMAMGHRAAQFAKEKFDSNVLHEKILERKKFLLGQ